MDFAGEALSPRFADWERSDTWLEMRDSKLHKRVRISHNQIFFEYDWCTGSELAQDGGGLVSLVAEKLGLQSVTWTHTEFLFGLDFDHEFERLSRRLRRLLVCDQYGLSGVLRDQMSDLAVVLETGKSDDRYTYTVGPMSREEWQEKVRYHSPLYGRDSENSLKSYIGRLASALVYLTITRKSKLQMNIAESVESMSETETRCKQFALDFVKFYRQTIPGT